MPLKLNNLLLIVLAVALLGLAVLRIDALNLSGNYISGRIGLKALPVTLSMMTMDRPHDYAAYMVVCKETELIYRGLPDKGSEATDYSLYSISSFIPVFKAIETRIKAFETRSKDPKATSCFWEYDDLGYADYMLIAFSAFGFTSEALWYLFIVLLAIPVALFAISFWNDTRALSLLNIGFIAYIAALPVLSTTVWEPTSIYAPRQLSLLSIFYFLYLVCFLYFRPVPLSIARRIVDLSLLAACLLIFGFLSFCRSTVGWQLLALFILIAMNVFWSILSDARTRGTSPLTAGAHYVGEYFSQAVASAKGAFSKTPTATAPVAVRRRGWNAITLLLALLITIAGLSLYKTLMFHEKYLGDYGTRTFYHNALMPLGDTPLGKQYDLKEHDGFVKRAVQQFLTEQGRQEEMQSWQARFGLAYETHAKEFYFWLWRQQPGDMIRHYIIKMGTIPVVLLDAYRGYDFADSTDDTIAFRDTLKHIRDLTPEDLQYLEGIGYRYTPLSVENVLLVLLVALLTQMSPQESGIGLARGALSGFAILVCSSIAYVSFYTKASIVDTAITFNALLYLAVCGLFMVALRFFGIFRRER